MKKSYRDKEGWLQHIFKEKVYSLASTQVIHNIAINNTLGFNETINNPMNKLRKADTLPVMKEDILQKRLFD